MAKAISRKNTLALQRLLDQATKFHQQGRLPDDSELARRDILAARTFIAERGYSPTTTDIRRCRQELMSFADGTPLKNVATGDFFTVSGCRDPLFHAQEHRFTLPDIGTFRAQNDLTLLGLDVGGRTQLQYRTRFPGDRSLTDLDLWHVFESENPATFQGRYQFWIQKKVRPAPPGV